ncbi:uncharacterized protein ACNS7B_015856 isoform 2-T2 [Menidia menidia]
MSASASGPWPCGRVGLACGLLLLACSPLLTSGRLTNCSHPVVPEHGGFRCEPSPCRGFPPRSAIRLFCEPGYRLPPRLQLSRCRGGRWAPPIPACVPAKDGVRAEDRGGEPLPSMATTAVGVSIFLLTTTACLVVKSRLCPCRPPRRRPSDQLDLVVDGPVALPSYEEAVYGSWGQRLEPCAGPTPLLLSRGGGGGRPRPGGGGGRRAPPSPCWPPTARTCPPPPTRRPGAATACGGAETRSPDHQGPDADRTGPDWTGSVHPGLDQIRSTWTGPDLPGPDLPGPDLPGLDCPGSDRFSSDPIDLDRIRSARTRLSQVRLSRIGPVQLRPDRSGSDWIGLVQTGSAQTGSAGPRPDQTVLDRTRSSWTGQDRIDLDRIRSSWTSDRIAPGLDCPGSDRFGSDWIGWARTGSDQMTWTGSDLP